MGREQVRKEQLVSHDRAGITLLEVMILLAAMAVLAALLLPGFTRPRIHPGRITCVNNLKQVGLGVRLWSMDHGDKFPMAVTMTNGGTMDHPLAHEPWIHLAILSNEINTPRVLVCPDDKRAKEVMDFGAGFGKANLSYFVGLDAEEQHSEMILSGDRNVTANGVAIKPGLHAVDGTATLGWSRAIHKYNGNIGLADGSVHQMSSNRLQQHLLDNPQTNRLAIP